MTSPALTLEYLTTLARKVFATDGETVEHFVAATVRDVVRTRGVPRNVALAEVEGLLLAARERDTAFRRESRR